MDKMLICAWRCISNKILEYRQWSNYVASLRCHGDSDTGRVHYLQVRARCMPKDLLGGPVR